MKHEPCPRCGEPSLVIVNPVTLANHLGPEHWETVDQATFHFCATPDCPAVYFSEDGGTVFTTADVRTDVGIKRTQDPIPVCYCLHVTARRIREEILDRQCCDSVKDIKEYTGANTGSACKLTNPAGVCCGAHARQVVKAALAEREATDLDAEATSDAEEIPDSPVTGDVCCLPGPSSHK